MKQLYSTTNSHHICTSQRQAKITKSHLKETEKVTSSAGASIIVKIVLFSFLLKQQALLYITDKKDQMKGNAMVRTFERLRIKLVI